MARTFRKEPKNERPRKFQKDSFKKSSLKNSLSNDFEEDEDEDTLTQN